MNPANMLPPGMIPPDMQNKLSDAVATVTQAVTSATTTVSSALTSLVERFVPAAAQQTEPPAAATTESKPSEAAVALRKQFEANATSGVARPVAVTSSAAAPKTDKEEAKPEAAAKKDEVAAPQVVAPKVAPPMVFHTQFAQHILAKSDGAKVIADEILAKVEVMAKSAAEDFEKATAAYHRSVKAGEELVALTEALLGRYSEEERARAIESTAVDSAAVFGERSVEEHNNLIHMTSALEAIYKGPGDHISRYSKPEQLCLGEYATLIIDALKVTHPQVIEAASSIPMEGCAILFAFSVVQKHRASDDAFRALQYKLNDKVKAACEKFLANRAASSASSASAMAKLLPFCSLY